MNREVNINLDISNRRVTTYMDLIKQGDNVKLTLTVFNKKVAYDIIGKEVHVFLKKSDNTKVEQQMDINTNIASCDLNLQATLAVGKTVGEINISQDGTQITSQTFAFNVEGAVSQEVLEESEDYYATYGSLINAVKEGSTILTDLTEENNKAGSYINSLGDINSVLGQVQENTASLSENTQNITNHKNALVTDSSGVHGLKVETGTFAPSLIGGTSGEVTYNGRTGIYTKVGNICTFSFNLQYASINGSQGYIIFTGLPYRSKMDMPLPFLTASVGIGNSKYIIAYLENGNQIVLYRQDGIEKLQTTDLADVGGWFNIGGTYIVSEE